MKSILTLLLLAAFTVPTAYAQDKFRVCWTIYAGWMPWGYGAEQGIVDKWAKKYGIDIEVVQVNDYIESINQYTAGAFDGCAMTNMDALTIPAASGVDTTALVVGDFSNGNDGVVLKGATSLADIKGQRVNLVELSVSHYLLARGLSTVGLQERDLTVVNTSDADLVGVFVSPDVKAVVTWNPLLSEVTRTPNSHKVFDSSQIPGEIIDLMVVNTETLKTNPKFGKALTGAWFEIMQTMSAQSDAGRNARTAMAKAAGTDLAGYESQLAATRMFYNPAEAVAFVQDPKLKQTMQYVAEFSFQHGLLGNGAQSAGVIGVETPSGVFGESKNIRLRFDPRFMQMAADGKL